MFKLPENKGNINIIESLLLTGLHPAAKGDYGIGPNTGRLWGTSAFRAQLIRKKEPLYAKEERV